MRSRASFKGHAVHPMLIPFPFAFLYGAFVFDLAGTLLDRAAWWTTGGHLAVAGVAMGLLAAVPGVIDYRHTVPPRSTARRRATKHALANSSALLLFLAAWLLRDGPPGVPLLAVEALAVGLLTLGGWMGGTLVSRNQIGVDHRYAGAGKWKEEHVAGTLGRPMVVARADELQVDQMKLLHVDGVRVVLARTEEGYVAFEDRCTHRGASLADGVLICGTVQCPWHGSQFDVRTGAVKAGPAERPIRTYELEETQEEIRLRRKPGPT